MKLCIIVNPNAGKKKGRAVAARVGELLKSSGMTPDTRISENPGETRDIARALDQSAFDGVIAVGGDGTLFEVINGLMDQTNSISIPVAQIPVGTGNSFLKDLEPEEPSQIDDPVERAVTRIIQKKTRMVDLGRFSSSDGDFYFINLLGAGFVSNVAYRAGKYKIFGSLSYIFGVLEEVVRLKPTAITLEIDGQIIEREGIFVEICNSRFTGGNMMMAPSAKIDDGLLDVMVLSKVSRGTILKLLPKIFDGSHVDHPAVEVFQGEKIRVRSEHPLALTPDGETFGQTPIDVEVHHHGVEMFA